MRYFKEVLREFAQLPVVTQTLVVLGLVLISLVILIHPAAPGAIATILVALGGFLTALAGFMLAARGRDQVKSPKRSNDDSSDQGGLPAA